MCHYLFNCLSTWNLDTLLQVSNSTRCTSLFCCWYNDELQIVNKWNLKACYHQNISTDHNTTYVQLCKHYSSFYRNRTASWQFTIMQWGMFSGDVLYAFVLKCTEREKPCVQESPFSVVITNKYLVCQQLKTELPTQGFDLLVLKWSSALLLLRLPSPHISAVLVTATFPSSFNSLSYLRPFLFPVLALQQAPGRGRGRTAEPGLENLQWKKGCWTTSSAGKSRSCFSPSPSWKSLLVLTSVASQPF